MAEICLDCLNRLTGRRDPKWYYILSKDDDLCEECGRYGPVVVVSRWVSWRRRLALPALIVFAVWLFFRLRTHRFT